MPSFDSVVFCLILCFLDSFMLLSIPGINFFGIVEQYCITWGHYSLYIHSLIDGYLDCFQLGVIMNKVTINIAHKSFCGHILSIHLNKYLGVELLGHRVISYLTYRKLLSVLQSSYSIWHFPLAIYKHSSCSTPSSIFYCQWIKNGIIVALICMCCHD